MKTAAFGDDRRVAYATGAGVQASGSNPAVMAAPSAFSGYRVR